MVFLNEKFMVLHCVLLFFLASDCLWVFYPLENGGVVKMWVWTCYLVIDFVVSCLIAFIMWQVAGKKDSTELDKSTSIPSVALSTSITVTNPSFDGEMAAELYEDA